MICLYIFVFFVLLFVNGSTIYPPMYREGSVSVPLNTEVEEKKLPLASNASVEERSSEENDKKFLKLNRHLEIASEENAKKLLKLNRRLEIFSEENANKLSALFRQLRLNATDELSSKQNSEEPLEAKNPGNSTNRMLDFTFRDLHLPDGDIGYEVSLHDCSGFFCAGALVSETYFITAAHCVVQRNPKDFWIRTGSSYLNTGGTAHEICHVNIHPGYNDEYYYHNDIALVRTDTPIETTSIKILRLPNMYEPDPAEHVVLVAGGYALTGQNHGQNIVKQELNVEVVSRCGCRNRTMGNSNVITNNQICVVSQISGPRQGTCFDDSGSPLIAHGTLIGIFSWSSPCHIGDPDVYTNVIKYVPWLVHLMELDEHVKFMLK